MTPFYSCVQVLLAAYAPIPVPNVNANIKASPISPFFFINIQFLSYDYFQLQHVRCFHFGERTRPDTAGFILLWYDIKRCGI